MTAPFAEDMGRICLWDHFSTNIEFFQTVVIFLPASNIPQRTASWTRAWLYGHGTPRRHCSLRESKQRPLSFHAIYFLTTSRHHLKPSAHKAHIACDTLGKRRPPPCSWRTRLWNHPLWSEARCHYCLVRKIEQTLCDSSRSGYTSYFHTAVYRFWCPVRTINVDMTAGVF